MANQPPVSKPVLSKDDLADLQRKLSAMSISGLRDFYHAAHYRCRLQDGTPPARGIQELVQAWKEMRKSR